MKPKKASNRDPFIRSIRVFKQFNVVKLMFLSYLVSELHRNYLLIVKFCLQLDQTDTYSLRCANRLQTYPSQIGRMAVDLVLKTYVQLSKTLLSRKKGKYIFCGDLPVMRL